MAAVPNDPDHEREAAFTQFVDHYEQGQIALDPAVARLLIALGEENRQLRADLRRLEARIAHRKAPIPPPPLRIERPLSYWAANLPDYDEAETLSSDEATAYLNRKRIDPASIKLTDAERARLPSARRRYQQRTAHTMSSAAQIVTLIFFICFCIFLLFLSYAWLVFLFG